MARKVPTDDSVTKQAVLRENLNTISTEGATIEAPVKAPDEVTEIIPAVRIGVACGVPWLKSTTINFRAILGEVSMDPAFMETKMPFGGVWAMVRVATEATGGTRVMGVVSTIYSAASLTFLLPVVRFVGVLISERPTRNYLWSGIVPCTIIREVLRGTNPALPNLRPTKDILRGGYYRSAIVEPASLVETLPSSRMEWSGDTYASIFYSRVSPLITVAGNLSDT